MNYLSWNLVILKISFKIGKWVSDGTFLDDQQFKWVYRIFKMYEGSMEIKELKKCLETKLLSSTWVPPIRVALLV